jgi:hypothetical protein
MGLLFGGGPEKMPEAQIQRAREQIMAKHIALSLALAVLSCVAVRAVRAAPLPDVVSRMSKEGIDARGDSEVVVQGSVSDGVHLFQLSKGHTYHVELTAKGTPVLLRIQPPEQTAVTVVHKPTVLLRASFRADSDGAYRFHISAADMTAGRYMLTLKAQPLPMRFDPPNVHHVGAGGLAIESALNALDPADRVRRNARCKIFEVRFQAGKTYTIDMMSKQFDTYLRLENPALEQLAADDDGGDGLNSRIQHRAQADGVYRVIATSFGANAVGNFSLRIREN